MDDVSETAERKVVIPRIKAEPQWMVSCAGQPPVDEALH
jgi:hypothetical protein